MAGDTEATARADRQRRPDVVVHAVSELWPYARSGGLGEAVRGIAHHQAQAGFTTAIVIPLYRGIAERFDLEPFGEPFQVRTGRHERVVSILRHDPGNDQPTVYFVRDDGLFDRGGLYGDEHGGFGDNALRYAVYSQALLRILPLISNDPPILHVHDWHASVCALQLRTEYALDPWYAAVPIVLTVHNAGYQGQFDLGVLDDLGLPTDGWAEWKGHANFLKGGLVFADVVTTVSPTHAKELTTDMGAAGLDPMFVAMGDRLIGILNGIDYGVWDPSNDGVIDARYSAEDLGPKSRNKAALQREYGLEETDAVPLFAMTARLAEQKGFDIILGSGDVGREGMQWVFLGEGEERYRRALQDLHDRFPDRVGVCFDFNETREHRLLAGSDFLIMPSLYEPCGLTQMRSQRYGSLPIGRRVGGLADTIDDGESGFLFDDYSPEALSGAVARARELFADRERLDEWRRSAMDHDFSWEMSVIQYQAVYARARAVRAAHRSG